MSALYTPDLITLNAARSDRRLAVAETGDDALIQRYISECSTEFAVGGLMRTPHPYIDTLAFDYYNPREIELGADLLAITTLTNGDGTALASTEYVTKPTNELPKWKVQMKIGSAYLFNYITSLEEAISIAGIWGYVPHYLRCWRQLTTLSGAVTDAVTTSITVTIGTLFEVGHYALIGSEQVKVTAIATNTLTVERGANGTTAATHSSNDAVKVFDQLPDIAGAVLAMVVYRYLHKDQIGSRVTVIDNGVVQVDDLDPRVQKTIDRHTRRPMFKAV
jgi:hypothetical protein